MGVSFDCELDDGGDVNSKFKGLIMWFLIKLKWWIFERKKLGFFYEDDEDWLRLYEDDDEERRWW